ncbi:methylenetetrahydrofolate reductase [Rathayibacter sp. VKM Ac-2759]|uniref:methylenetetrahydrofolate reductase n=1 Tax=Rathayibacter sp. VKM Ac-2759 TaxID=2609252 RepID=UPI001318EDB0|nr:methylenetetrahydrofolate reductase [Rathayibacter sp. VKM Ac-2759]QHC68053.1 methylenetetrahydrofolate reductase [Rathayibacter sp. VKM Ac-2759]
MRASRLEIVPTPGVVDRIALSLPRGSAISVTALPHHGIATTVETAIELAGLGFDAIPHLAATRIPDRAQLARLLDRLDAAGVQSLFVIGGDGDRASSAFEHGGDLLATIRELTGDRFRLGVAGYPEGHPQLSVGAGIDVLAGKAPLADFVVTQMCFSPEPILAYLRALRSRGIGLPVWLGVPGAVRLRRLLGIAARIGVGPSLSFAGKGGNLRLLGRFDAPGFCARLETQAEQARLDFAGFHVYSFNDFALRAPTTTEHVGETP